MNRPPRHQNGIRGQQFARRYTLYHVERKDLSLAQAGFTSFRISDALAARAERAVQGGTHWLVAKRLDGPC